MTGRELAFWLGGWALGVVFGLSLAGCGGPPRTSPPCDWPGEDIAASCADASFVEEAPAGVVTCHWPDRELEFRLDEDGCYRLVAERRHEEPSS